MNISSYGGYQSNQTRFREFPERQQFKILDQLISNAQRHEDPSGQMKDLAQSLRLRSTSHLEVGLMDTADALDKPNAGDGVRELAKALGLEEMPVDVALGNLADKLAGQTNPNRPAADGFTK